MKRPRIIRNCNNADVRIDGYDGPSRKSVSEILREEGIATTTIWRALDVDEEGPCIVAFGWSLNYAEAFAQKLADAGAYVTLLYRIDTSMKDE